MGGQSIEIIGEVKEFVACAAKPDLSCQVPQDFSHVPVFLRLRGRREIFDHVDFPPIGLIGSTNAVEGFEFRADGRVRLPAFDTLRRHLGALQDRFAPHTHR